MRTVPGPSNVLHLSAHVDSSETWHAGPRGLRNRAGLMGMSHVVRPAEERDERESIATIHRAIELGCTFFDTAEVYGPYTNEELLGRALRQLGRARPGRDRHQVRLQHRGTAASSGAGQPPGAHSRGGRGLAAAASDRPHRPALPAPRRSRGADRGCRGHDGRAGARGQGAVPGLSEAGEQTIRRAHAVHPISALQSEYSLWERNLEPRSSRCCASSASAWCRSRRSAAAS